jgi:hypothetical protein
MLVFLTKQATLMRRSTVLSLPLQLVFPGKDVVITKENVFVFSFCHKKCFKINSWIVIGIITVLSFFKMSQRMMLIVFEIYQILSDMTTDVFVVSSIKLF